MNGEFLWTVGFVLVVVGFVIVVVAMFWIMLSGGRTQQEGEEKDREYRVRGGGVIIIGPIPIVLGTDRQTVKVLLVLAVVLVALLLVFTVFSQGWFI